MTTSAANAMSSSLNALTREYEGIANNLANVNTVGFKRQSNSFTKSLAAQLGGGIECKDNFDFTQGNFVETGNKLDLALAGKGFMVVETPDGPLYTRNGILQVNSKGQIVDLRGRLISGKDGPLVLPMDGSGADLKVAEDGNIKAGHNTVGKLKLVDFGTDEKKLVPVGNNCWAAPKGVKPKNTENITIRQGYQESSNVRPIDEMVDLISVSRLYQSTMKVVNSESDNSKSLLGVAMG